MQKGLNEKMIPWNKDSFHNGLLAFLPAFFEAALNNESILEASP